MELFGLDILGIVIRIGLGLAVGFCIGLTGVGGGVLVLPALTIFLRMNAVMAVGTASLYSFLAKISATIHHAKLKTIDWKLSLLFLAGAVPADILVASWVADHGGSEEFANALQHFITGMVFFCVAVMLWNLIRQIRNQKATGSPSLLSDHVTENPMRRRLLGVAMGGVVGALIGATSIGGGVLIVPILMVLFGLQTSRTVGSSIFIALVLTMMTSVIYGRGGEVDWATALVMAAGSLIGVPLGSKLSVKIPDRILYSVVIVLVFAVAIMMLIKDGGH
ncbi:MAG: sulfite exporter TauE/SafE family protein [Kiritimatiellales bacterium]|nr:sulfite exporter TauE/SafE family protein [Kiritimatiellota bacterium]MBL7011787.1 sulfite exporter TauE/SafE family protein [Kiritimatiellales bacterium]